VPQPQRAKTLAPSPALNVPKRNITEARYERNRAVVSLRAGCSSEVDRIGFDDSAPMLNGCEPTESLGIVGLRAILAFEQRRRRASI